MKPKLKTPEVYNPYRLFGLLTFVICLTLSSANIRAAQMVEFTLTFANTAPQNGTYLTPIWVGFHNGSYDLFDGGMPASMALERLAEDGDAAPLMAAFAAASGTGHQHLVTSGVEPPVFAPGQSRTVTFTLDSRDPHNRFLSLASMIIPSNDAFIANDDPMKFRVFDDNGKFVLNNFSIAGMMVYDAGTEMNDEIPENTAFLAQAAPNTGVTENAMVMPHPGFLPGGTILSNPMFASANFRMDGYSVLGISWLEKITISSITVDENQVILDWFGGLPPYQVQWREQIVTGLWMNVGNPINTSEMVVDISAPTGFFQVVPSRTLEPTAQYTVEFKSQWSQVTHPMNFPDGAHFSGLIGATHNSGITFWAGGMLASNGIELMAETGGKALLQNEVNAAIASGSSRNLLSGSGISSSPGSVTLDFEIHSSHPLVTLVSMMAPSPDWFVGVHNLNLIAGNQWVDTFTVDLFPYDAGTDDGENYTSPDADTQPKMPIHEISGSPFLNSNGLVAPIGTFKFIRLME
ncbi:MAG: spondin domain-containing protein [Verrucomicrobia bacterium]|nr:spondin domain-containing protein [Verrucomicrobiota bacterium]